jgi:hypothetical protein
VWASLATERSPSKAARETYLPLTLHMAQEINSEEFAQAKQMKNELSKITPIYSE